jgi:hypothetical protein
MIAEIYYNALRYSLIQQIKLIKTKHRLPYQGKILDNYVLCSGFLGELEGFAPQDLETESNRTEILNLISHTLQADYGKFSKTQPDKNNVAEIIKQIHKQLKIDLKKADSFPQVPHRQPLTKIEWENVWENFDLKLKKQKGHRFLDDSTDSFVAIEQYIMQEFETLYYVNPLSHHYAYKLSGKWFREMYMGNLFYWLDADFTWAIYADGYGYPQYYGYEFEHLINC